MGGGVIVAVPTDTVAMTLEGGELVGVASTEGTELSISDDGLLSISSSL